jgi:hypothetical protein
MHGFGAHNNGEDGTFFGASFAMTVLNEPIWSWRRASRRGGVGTVRLLANRQTRLPPDARLGAAQRSTMDKACSAFLRNILLVRIDLRLITQIFF